MGILKLLRLWVAALYALVQSCCVVLAQTPGQLDPAFVDPQVSGGSVLVPQSDGRVIVTGGTVVTLSPIAIRSALRLNEDGTIDPNYNVPGASFTGLALLPDGRSLAWGTFTTLGASTSRNLALLKTTGEPDAGFATAPVVGNPLPTVVVAVPDGSGVYVGYAGGLLVRLGLNGAKDPAFVPGSLDAGDIQALAVQASGKVLVAQSGKIFRLNSDGGRDPLYVETTFASATPRFALSAEGSLFVGGTTAAVTGGGLRTLFKLKPDGGLDPSFKYAGDGTTAGDKTVARLVLQPDGKLLANLAGSTLFRLLADGSVDPGFTSPTTPNVFALDAQGRIVVIGTYIQITPKVLVRSGIFRLLNNGVPQKPSITLQPAGQKVFAGIAVEFQVGVGGTPPFSFQWQFQGQDLVGAVSNRLVLSTVAAANAGDYQVVVTNLQGRVVSSNAVLVVESQPRILVPPQPVTAYTGDSVVLLATVAGEAPLSLQWWHGPQSIAGATATNLIFPALTTADAGDYAVVVSNSFGAVTSSFARITVRAVLPQWTVLTNTSTAGLFTNAPNPFRPETVLKEVSDGRRGIVLLYNRGVERWNDAGERLWSTRYVEPNFGQLGALALDRDGNAYVSGVLHNTATFGEMPMTNTSTVIGPNGHQQAFVAKLDPDGHALWYRLFEAAGPAIWDLTVAADGGVVFVGRHGGKLGRSYLGTISVFEDDYTAAVLGKLSPTGVPQWLQSYPQFTFNRSTCEANTVVADESGIYLSGMFSSSIQFGTLQLLNVGVPGHWLGKVSTNGEPVWIQRTGGTALQGDPLALRGGQLWFLLTRDNVAQHWSPAGALLGSLNLAPGIRQLGLTGAGEPVAVGSATTSLAVGGTTLTAGPQRPFVWYARWNTNGTLFNARVLATTTNAVPGNGSDGIQLGNYAVSEAGDVYLSGGFNNAVKLMGQIYPVPAKGFAGDFNTAGAYLVKLSAASLLPVPQFTQQPIAAYTLQTGDSVRIGVKVNSPLPVTWQWRHDGIPVAGATNDFYQFTDAVVTDGGLWDCVASNAYGSTPSEPSRITVAPPFTIRTQPQSRMVLLGGEVSGAAIDGVAFTPNSLADKRLNFVITNSTSPRFPLAGKFELRLQPGSYEIPGTGDLGAHQGAWQVLGFASDFADVRLSPWTFDQGRPNGALGLLLGGRFNLHLDIAAADGCCAEGTFTLSGGTNTATFQVATTFFVPDGNYQWQKDGVDLPGRTASRLELGTVTAADTGFYRCLIRYKGYAETSLAAELRILTGAGPLPPPPLVFTPFQAGSAGLTIPAWPAGFVLQRTASLEVLNWQTVATTPPYTVPLVNANEYFRLIPTP